MVKYCAILFLLKRPLTRALLCVLFCCGVSLLPSHLPRALLPKRGEYTSLLWIFVAKKCGCYDVLLLASDSVPSFLLVTVGNPVLPALGSAHQPLHPTLTKVSILWQVTWWWIVCSDIPCRVGLFFFQLRGTSSSFGIFWQASNAACFRAETFYWLMGFVFFCCYFFLEKIFALSCCVLGPFHSWRKLRRDSKWGSSMGLTNISGNEKKRLATINKKFVWSTLSKIDIWKLRKQDGSCCHFVSGTVSVMSKTWP